MHWRDILNVALAFALTAVLTLLIREYTLPDSGPQVVIERQERDPCENAMSWLNWATEDNTIRLTGPLTSELVRSWSTAAGKVCPPFTLPQPEP